MSKTKSIKKRIVARINKYGPYRDGLEEYLWNILLNSKKLKDGRWVTYFNTYDGSFSTHFLADGEHLPFLPYSIFIMKLDGSVWETLHSEYEERKEWFKDDEDEMNYTFDEWIEKEAKRDYLNETVDLIIGTLEPEIE